MKQVAFQNFFVAFIDLLGFSNMVNHDCEQPDGGHIYLDSLYAAHKRANEIKKDIADLHVFQFSDSIVLATPYNSKVFASFILAIADYQYSLLTAGILCRGGVSYGKHFAEGNFIFSNGLIDAYKLESCTAVNPRIILSENLIELLYPNAQGLLAHKIIKENDGQYFINYFCGRSPNDCWNSISKMLLKNQTNTPSVAMKNQWLLEYFNFSFPDNIQMPTSRFNS